MKEISLTRNQKTIVDDEDYQQLSSFKWQCSTNGYDTRSELKSERSSVSFNGKKYGCGSFKTEEEAFEAYKKKYMELYGESHLSWILY